MLSKRTTLAVLCAAALVACDAADSITGPSTRPGPSASLLPEIEIPEEFLPGVPVLDPFAAAWNDDAGVVESARGGGHWHVTPEALRTFAFTAKNRADGSVQGQYQINNRDVSGSREHGTVTCLDIVGNEAWIGGVITHSSLPGREGTPRLFRVIDRGEGSGDPPDQASGIEVPEGLVTCHLKPPMPVQDLEGGNIQVRDGT